MIFLWSLPAALPEMLAHKILLPFPVCPCQVDRAFGGDSDGRDADGAAAGGLPFLASDAGHADGALEPHALAEDQPVDAGFGRDARTPLVCRLADSLRQLIPAASATVLPVLLCPSPAHNHH